MAIVLMSAAAAASDAFTFFGDRVFASVMTGNLVLLGISITSRDGSLAAHAGASLLGYAMGASIGARLCVRGSDWPAGTRPALAIELGLLGLVAAARGLVSGALGYPVELFLLGCLSAGMGLQSALNRAAPRSPTSTTYLTGTLTRVISSLARGRGVAPEHLTLATLGAAVLGAGADAALVHYAHRLAPMLPVALIAATLAVLWRRA